MKVQKISSNVSLFAGISFVNNSLNTGISQLIDNELGARVKTVGFSYINTKLNLLNIKSLLLTKQLKKDTYYDFDYDNQIIATEKYDTKHTYKHTKGYYFVEKVAKYFEGILPTTRLKRFIFRFISVAGKWIYTGRQWVLKLFTDKPYKTLVV